MLRIGRAAAVTAQHDLVPLAEAFHQALGNLINSRRTLRHGLFHDAGVNF
jgi:hypothetical protein